MTDQHILQETFDSLPKLDYLPLLDAILKELKTTKIIEGINVIK